MSGFLTDNSLRKTRVYLFIFLKEKLGFMNSTLSVKTKKYKGYYFPNFYNIIKIVFFLKECNKNS